MPDPVIKSGQVYRTADGAHFAYVALTDGSTTYVPLRPLGLGWSMDEDSGAKVPIQVLGNSIERDGRAQEFTFAVPLTPVGLLELGATVETTDEATGEAATDD